MKTAITTTAQHQAEERTAPLDRSTERHEGFAQLHAAILQAAADAPEWQAEAHELRYYSLHGPTKSKAVVQFAYRCGEAIGRMTVENSRPRLLALAAKVKANAAAFDGKPRRARVPYKTTRGNPFDAARDAVARGLESEALPLIEAACGPVFIGAGKDPRRPPLYAYAQTVTMGGIEWTIARLVAPGSVWHILHTASGRAAKTAGFPCRFRSAADTLSTLALMTDEATDSGYLQRARAAIVNAPAFDQATAAAALFPSDEADTHAADDLAATVDRAATAVTEAPQAPPPPVLPYREGHTTKITTTLPAKSRIASGFAAFGKGVNSFIGRFYPKHIADIRSEPTTCTTPLLRRSMRQHMTCSRTRCPRQTTHTLHTGRRASTGAGYRGKGTPRKAITPFTAGRASPPLRRWQLPVPTAARGPPPWHCLPVLPVLLLHGAAPHSERLATASSSLSWA